MPEQVQLKQQVLDETAARLRAARPRSGAAAVSGDPPLSGAAWYQQQATRYRRPAQKRACGACVRLLTCLCEAACRCQCQQLQFQQLGVLFSGPSIRRWGGSFGTVPTTAPSSSLMSASAARASRWGAARHRE